MKNFLLKIKITLCKLISFENNYNLMYVKEKNYSFFILNIV